MTHAWAKMQTSNHFHWMSAKGGGKSPLAPYPGPREAHDRFMSVLDDLRVHLDQAQAKRRSPHSVPQ
jgi:hypothetical protein